MKIAYLLGSLNRGGTETLILDTFRYINNSAIDAICVYRKNGGLYNDFRNTKIKMYVASPKKGFVFFYIRRLRNILSQNAIQIAHAQQPIDALYAYLACIGLKTKVILTIHGYDFRYPKLTKQILNFIHKRTAKNIFVSNSQMKYFSQKYSFDPKNAIVVYNGIHFEKFRNVKTKSIRKEFGIPQDHMLLGSVGNFNPARDQLTICRFLNLLSKTNIKFSFIFAGTQTKADPAYWEECHNYCLDNNLLSNVYFPGLRHDIPNFLSQLDAFIYSTDHDTFGIAIIEAISMGLPVFVNDWEVIREITENGKHAILFKTKNEQDLLYQFELFYNNRQQYLESAKISAKWANHTYSIQNHLSNISDVYKDCVIK